MRKRAALALGLTLLTLAPVHAAQKPYRISATLRDDAGKWQPTDVLTEKRLNAMFQIRFLEPEARPGVLKQALGRELDFLPGRTGERSPGFLVFVLQIENASTEDINFNPTQARLASNKGDVKFALDYSALYEVASRMGPSGPSLDELAQAVFDRAVRISPGGSVRKLIVFDAPRDDVYRDFEVRLHEVNVGTTAVDVVFPFRKFFQDK
ncbi:MAG TPA: hypothetical protein VFG76_11750 [Candidatus Polarisedimenticolia bacterium]|nr:hypothetical protein [Candidatus Polarisedimenticolia bacterium]